MTPEQQLRVRRFVVDMRAAKPIAIIDAYYDHDGQALCPAATGISHHISPWGDIEPCPIIQFATETIHDQRGLARTFIESELLKDFRDLARSSTRGCIVLEHPEKLVELALKHGARDTTVRGRSLAELQAMTPRPSQYSPGNEIPEKSWFYRFAKRHWFNDFGAYAETAATQLGHGLDNTAKGAQ